MDDCVRNCKRIAVIEESSTTSFSKKRKIDFPFEELELPSLNVENLRIHNRLPNSPLTSSNSDALWCSDVSVCSSNESCEIINDTFTLIDLEETETSTCINNNFSRETTPSSEICGDSPEMDSPAKKPSPSKAEKKPSQAEIDEFFSVSEKEEQKRFTEKYNYDIVKDAPLDGRYKWVRLEREGC